MLPRLTLPAIGTLALAGALPAIGSGATAFGYPCQPCPHAGVDPARTRARVAYAEPLAATLTEEGVRLTWRIGGDGTCARFAIERSTAEGSDGDFVAVDSVDCAWGRRTYDWLDREAPAETLRYRLRRMDADPADALSDVVEVSLLSAAVDASEAGVEAYGRTLVNLGRRSARVTVLDAGGRQLLVRQLGPGEEGSLAELSRGAYLLVARAGDGSRQVLRVSLP